MWAWRTNGRWGRKILKRSPRNSADNLVKALGSRWIGRSNWRYMKEPYVRSGRPTADMMTLPLDIYVVTDHCLVDEIGS